MWSSYAVLCAVWADDISYPTMREDKTQGKGTKGPNMISILPKFRPSKKLMQVGDRHMVGRSEDG